ncbi:MAG: FG-GAP-like repeat-containing protein, partial [Pyrinomonadaceae bacterium]
VSALNQEDFGLVRYNSDGSLDTSFGTGGKVIMNVGITGAPSEAQDVAVQQDGKIVFAGWSGPGTNRNFAVLRYLPNGLPDTSFDGDGQVSTDFLNGNDQAFAVAVQADGKIVAAGYASNGTNDFVALARYNTDGSLDASFGSGGKLTTAVLGIYDYVYDLIVQPDGKIVAAGYGYNGSNSDIALVRYNSNGSLDTSFGSGGKTIIPVLSSDDEAYAVVLQADGKIVATGSAYNGTSLVFTAVRVNANGTLDSTFDGDGRLTTAIPSTREGANSVVIQPDGKIVTAGIRDDNFTTAIALTRYNSNGSLDTTFDGDGQIITTGGIANSIALQTNGKIVVGGSSNSDFALYRYNTDGSLDASYGIGGKAAFDVAGGATDTISCLALDSTGRAIVGGISGQYFAVARVLGDFASARTPFDFDGDGKADLSVFRPSAGSWYISNSSNNAFVSTQFGVAGDLIAPADFDGDGKTDICVFRPSDGGWYRLNSSNNTFTAAQFGTNGDLPTPGDFDGDGRADLTVYRPSAGSWFRVNSSNNQFVAVQFGVAEDKPLVGDFDGDGKADLTVFRPSNGTWYRIDSATNTFSPNQFGATGDLPVPADYDGDGKTDLAVYRPSVGDWYIVNSGNSSFTGLHFGVTEDKPAPADFDGDGRADLVVFRPSSGTWYLLRTTAGFTGFQFGTQGDIPTPNAFVR